MIQLRGVRVEFDTNQRDNVFRRLVEPVPFEKFDWATGYSFEVYSDEGNQLDLQQTLSGFELRKFVEKFHFAYGASFIGYPPGTKAMYEVDDYDEFMNSEATMVILLLDNRYFDFYCKDQTITRSLAQHFKMCAVPWEYIDENDPRTSLTLG